MTGDIVEVGRLRGIVARVIDEESIGHCRKKIEEYLPETLTEEEIQEWVKDILEGQFKNQPDAPGADELREAIILGAKGDQENVKEYERRVRMLEASKTSSTVTVRGNELPWKKAVELFRGMPERELMSFVHSVGDCVENVLARLVLQERRPGIDEETPQGAGRGGNEEIGRRTEIKATEFLQGKLREQADVIRRGGQGQPDLEVIFRAPKRPREFVAVKSTKELRTKRPSVTYSNLGTCPEATEARRHGRPFFFLLVEDRNAGRWCMRQVPVGTERMKVTVADFGRFELPQAFGR
ncbi:MAG: hypothetical protein JRN58_09865 [Nitrososphaerota archaeon]|nr:hypothetical protein [Nitrososphaerota archaeon]MDG6979372.1 hypothetical protein [Nitrososphaerota archaeon]